MTGENRVTKALYDYKKNGETELDLAKGQTCTVLKSEKGWSNVINEEGEFGWVPSSFLEGPQSEGGDQRENDAKKTLQNEEKNENLNLQNRNKKLCTACKNELKSSFISANGFFYHENCFACSSCEKSIKGKQFVAKNGKNFCQDCAKQKLSPQCAFCDEAIEGEYIIALGKNWHKDHFLCCDCGESFESSFHNREGRPYCSKCFSKNFLRKCDGCHSLIADKYLKVGNLSLHFDCFKCSEDGRKLSETEAFHIKNGKIFCSEHSQSQKSLLCKFCQKEICGEFIRVKEDAFHEDCFLCFACNSRLAGQSFHEHEGHFYCDKHNKRKESNEETKEKGEVLEAKRETEGLVKSQNEMEEEMRNARHVYKYEELKNPCEKLPSFLEYSKRQNYLSDAEFEEVFSMTKEEFGKLTLWKQRYLKKEKELF